MLIVQKFGGSSLADIEGLRRAASLCIEARRRGNQLLAVVSASGDSTDELIESYRQITASPKARETDAFLACGEQKSAALMAMMLESMGERACSFTGWQAGIFTDDNHGAAGIKLILPQRLQQSLEEGCIPVVAGFQGVCLNGDISTLGRGGSDLSAVALAAALEAGRCEIYTDVDGVYTADPRLIGSAKYMREIDYRDMLALSRAGSQLLQPEAVRLAMGNEVRVQLLSSFKPSEGSRLCRLPEDERPDFAGVTRNITESSVSAVGRAVGADTLSRLVLLLGRAGVPVLKAGLEENTLTMKVIPQQLSAALQLVHSALIE